ncbi:hypothetical protein GGX14DRAFT_406488 [Mycena pura]|uniref:Uncharacterized protein n=1 Tax=Mycena pura TaxID=153505 RepID=A0AAD6UQ88_9AGAR|nr:hypothetical protein GGX14DRAFT_406488 [Mycena pura]
MAPDSELYSIESHFEGPFSTGGGNQVVISIVLEPGTESHFSGIQIVVCCREDSPRLHKLSVEDDVGAVQFMKRQREHEQPPAGQREVELLPRGREKVDLLLKQEAAHKASDALLDQGLPALKLPLYTVAYEVEDTNSTSMRQYAKLVLLPTWPTAHGTHRIAYQFVQLAHDPVVLYLLLSCSLCCSSYRSDFGPMGIFAFTVHVCPPQAQRRPFAQPPPEILSSIFDFFAFDAQETSSSWRPAVVVLALVCRAWVIALEQIFHHFGFTRENTDLVALSKAVQAAPHLGGAIRHLSRSYFGWNPEYEQLYLELAVAFKNVLHAATHVQTLEIFDTHPSLREEFMQVLGESSNIRSFAILPVERHLSDEERGYRFRPTLSDLFRCFQRWPRLQKLELYGWDGPNPLLQTVKQFTVEQTPPLDCALRKITLALGHITGPQLCNLTAGSHASISNASFISLVGLSNAGMQDWLLQVAPTLVRLSIERCSIVRASAEEAYALDAAMGALVALTFLRVDGDVLSELTVLRRPVRRPPAVGRTWRRDIIDLKNCPGVSPHGLVQALKHTGWQEVSTSRLFEGNEPLFEKAKAVAKERGLAFS